MQCNFMVSQKVSKAVTPAKLVLDLIGERESPAAGLIFLDSRFHGNDNNGCFMTFYEFIKFRSRASRDQISLHN